MNYLTSFHRSKKQSGSLIYMSVLGFAVLFMFLAYLNDMLVMNRNDVEMRIKLDGLALNISEAGLFETLAQFRKKGSMQHMRNPMRDGAGAIQRDVDDNIIYLDEENYVDFSFNWTCRNAAIGCPNILDIPFHYEINYDALFEDHSNDICDMCDLAGRPQKGFYVLESEEPKIGVVRNFDVLGKIAEFDPVTNTYINTYGDLKVRYEVWQRMVEDYTKETGTDANDSGRIWVARSIGIVYRVNQVSGAKELETLSTVVQTRMYKKPTIFLPEKSALFNTHTNGKIQINSNAQVINNGDMNTVYSGLYGLSQTITTAYSNGNVIDFGYGGAPLKAYYPMDFESIFGLDETQMKEFADAYITDMADSRLYSAMKNSEVRYIVGSPSYSTAKPLLGNGLLIVDGNITINGIGHKFDGIVWCTGNVTIKAGGYIKGCIIAGARVNGATITLSVQGDSASSWFYVYFDPENIANINNKKFKYTMFRVPYVKKGTSNVVLTDDEKELRKELIFARYH